MDMNSQWMVLVLSSEFSCGTGIIDYHLYGNRTVREKKNHNEFATIAKCN